MSQGHGSSCNAAGLLVCRAVRGWAGEDWEVTGGSLLAELRPWQGEGGPSSCNPAVPSP